MRKKGDNEKKGKNAVLTVMASVLFSFMISAVIFLIYAAILTYTNVSEKYLQTIVCITTAAAVFAGGFCCSRFVRKRGIVCGAITGLIYAIVMAVAAYCINADFSFSAKTILIFVISICGGGLGGIAGINI